MAIEPVFAGIEHGRRDSQERSTEDAWLHLGVLIGTIQRHECRNDDLRLVFREFSILGPELTLAAHAAPTSRAHDLDEPFNWAGTAPPTLIDHVPGVARPLGLNVERLVRDMEDPSLNPLIERSVNAGSRFGQRAAQRTATPGEPGL